MNIGLNLFSIRKSIQTEQDFGNTCLKLKEMGYNFLQFSGATFDAEMIKRVSDKYDMPVYLTHVPMDRILGDTDKLMEEHALFNCKNIGLGMLGLEFQKDEEIFKQKVQELQCAAQKMKEKGFKLFYHNHHYECVKMSNGQRRLDYMIENAPDIHFTVDIYWVQYGGLDIIEYLEKMKGRIECVHLKDYEVYFLENECKPKFAPIGQGNLDMCEIIKKAKACGTEYFFVEQDDACDYDNPFNEIEKSVKYLKNLEV